VAYTTLELITDAYYITDIVSPEFDTLNGFQSDQGLKLLNFEVIADLTTTPALIPYYDKFTFDFISGQEEYYIPNIIEIETLTFTINDYRYSTYSQGRRNYFGNSRTNTTTSLPYKWHLEPELGGGRLFIYFLPDSNYPVEIYGKFRISEVTLFQDLSLSLDTFYISYLKYKLSERLFEHYNISIPPNILNRIKEYDLKIRNIAPLDLTTQKISLFPSKRGPNYVQSNLGRGWTP